MKAPSLMLFVLLITIFSATAQNKTFGVGITSPNPNAALHVESPTSNQGFIMPRLSTTQRQSISPLTSVDKGLMVFDTDLNRIYVWSGSQWEATTGPSLPYKDSVLSGVNNSNLFKIVYNSNATENVGVAQFSNYNANNGFNTLFVTNAGTNGAGYFQVTNTNSLSPALRSITNSAQANVPAFLARTTGTGGSAGQFEIVNTSNNQSSIKAVSNGTGNAANFSITNNGNTTSALSSSTNGMGPGGYFLREGTSANASFSLGSAVYGENQGPGPGGYFLKTNGSGAGSSVEAINQGTDDGAAAFGVINSTNTSAAIFAQTTGTGPVMYFTHNGASGNIAEFNNSFSPVARIEKTGKIVATSFQGDGSLLTNLPASGLTFPYLQSLNTSSPTFEIRNSGNAPAARFSINNATSTGDALVSETDGLQAAGRFRVNNTSSNYSGLITHHYGTGPSFDAWNYGTGAAAILGIANAASSNTAMSVSTNGTGSVASFSISNASNSSPAVNISTSGTNNALSVSTSSLNNTSAIAVATSGSGNVMSAFQSGTGFGIDIQMSNISSSQPALNINHSGTGNAIVANKPIQATAFIGDGSALTNLPSSGWGLTGNTGTVDATSFIGTTDNTPLNFRVNNQKAGRIDQLGSNTFFGYQAGEMNSGSNNSYFGYQAGRQTTTGVQNSALGNTALAANTTGTANVAVGHAALSSNTSGIRSVAIGYAALLSNNGSENTAVGFASLFNNTTGTVNTAIGNNALNLNTIGIQNTAVGSGALQNNLNGNVNTAIGISALQGNTSGSQNSAIGSALFANTTGSGGVALGYYALATNTTGNNNTAIGVFADVSANNLTNATAIGNSAVVNASNKIRLGNSSVTVIEGQVAFTAASDKRLKYDIQNLDEGLEFILKLKPVSYYFKNQTDKKLNWGFIAQDIEALVGTENALLTIGGDNERTLGLRYTDLIAPLVKSVQDQQKLIDQLLSEVQRQSREIESLKSSLISFNVNASKD